jgi:hypothetical protein
LLLRCCSLFTARFFVFFRKNSLLKRQT